MNRLPSFPILFLLFLATANCQRGNRLGWAPASEDDEGNNGITPLPEDGAEGGGGGGGNGIGGENDPVGPEGPKRERIPENGSVSHAPMGRVPNRITSTMAPERVGPAFSCRGKKNGYYADTTNCEKFHYCFWDRDFVKSCPPGSAWNGGISRCDWKKNVASCRGEGGSAAAAASSGNGGGANAVTRAPIKTTTTRRRSTRKPNVISTVRYNDGSWNGGRWNNGMWNGNNNNNNWNRWNNNYITSTKKPPTSIVSDRFTGNCPPSGTKRYVDATGCHKYVECVGGQKYNRICKYPEYFDSKARECRDFNLVRCEGRFEAKSPCDYRASAPYNIRGTDCGSIPNCVGRPDGTYPDTLRECRAFYRCVNGRTIEVKACNSMASIVFPQGSKFSSITQKCENAMTVPYPCGPQLPKDKAGIVFCPKDANGWWADPTDCRVYHLCYHQGSHRKYVCPAGTIWSQERTACIVPSAADKARCKV